MQKKKSFFSNKRYFDFSLLFIVLFLIGFGLVMIYSTSSYSAALDYDGDGLYFLRKQLISAAVGIVGMLVLCFIPYGIYKNFALIIYILSAFSILLVLTPLGHIGNGARRWVYLFGMSIQPAEIVKVGLIIFLAALLSKMSNKERASWKGIFITLIPAGIISGMLYIITNNLSSALIVAGIAVCMLAISTPKCYKLYILLALGAIGAILLVVGIAKGFLGSGMGFRGERILAWLNPEGYADGKGFQVLQSLYGIGSGGIWGKGLGKSMQKLGFLPEAQNDMIFSIICEELGLFGGLSIILMFILLLWRIRDAGVYCTDMFGNLLVTGIFSHVAIQVIINIAVATNSIPNTGMPLPFISYGGSSIIFILAEMGIVMNVARNADFKDRREEKPAEAEDGNEEA
ncbi:MAG: putative lipid II flippase FtsW [Lachnospiraceae bacterium]|nr:putative lipid II flippase FtsW [Lachnospiraceae bacterium]